MVEFCLGKEKEKPLGAGEEPGDKWGGKITYFGLKMNHLLSDTPIINLIGACLS